MGYQIRNIEKCNIFIEHDCRDELDGFIMMLKTIESEIGGRIFQMDGDEVCYTISGDPYELIYRWDSQSGISVLVSKQEYLDEVVNMLELQFAKLNN